MDALISVVLPVYNVEKYLDRCMERVVGQTYKNLEILLIDDGSTDSSAQMCDLWAKKDTRIKVIHKQNAGLGMARNTGIENATGEYMCFFDSDDYIAYETIEKTYCLAQEEKAELVLFGLSVVDRRGNIVQRFIPESVKACYREEEVLEKLLPSLLRPDMTEPTTRNLRLSAWSCLFSMERIRKSGWRFVSEREIISEDIYSLLDLYGSVNAVAVCKEAFYYYCENDSSLTRSYRPDRFEKNIYCYQKCVELCMLRDYPREVKKGCISPFLGNLIAVMKQEVAYHPKRKAAIAALRKILKHPVTQEVLQIKKNDMVTPSQRVLFFAMRHRIARLCYLLLAVKNSMKS